MIDELVRRHIFHAVLASDGIKEVVERSIAYGEHVILKTNASSA
jgi:hypothetical protein